MTTANLESAATAPPGEIKSHGVDKNQARQACFVNPNFLAALAMPDMFRFGFSPIIMAIWQLITGSIQKDRVFERFAIGLPRGHAKTTIIKVIILWTILFTKKKFILVVCATDDRAKDILSDVEDMLSTASILNVFGDWRHRIKKDNAFTKQFFANDRQIVLAAMGFGSSVRGLNLGNSRPDFMIFDDAQTQEIALDPDQAEEFRRKLYGTWLKLKSPQGCTYAYIGNMYKNVLDSKGRFCCMLRAFKDDPNWTTFITGAILQDGNALWPELFDVEYLLNEFRVDAAAGEEETWFAEVQNDPEGLTAFRIDTSKMRIVDYPIGHQIEAACIIIDPAGDKPGSDDQVYTHVDIDSGQPVVRRTTVDNSNPKQFIYNVLQYAMQYQIPCIAVESVAYQATLKFWFNEFIAQWRLHGISVVELTSGRNSKPKRIIPAMKSLIKGDYSLHVDAKTAVIAQAANYDPTERKPRDDILDTIGYIPQVLEKYRFQCIKPLEAMISATTDTVEPDYNFENNILGLTAGNY